MEISFGPQDDRCMPRPHNDALVIIANVAGTWVARTFVDTGSLVNIMYYDCLKLLNMDIELRRREDPYLGFQERW